MGTKRHCDLMIENAMVFTMDADMRRLDRAAIAIEAGRILDIGPFEDIGPAFSPTETIDAKGAPVHPGFIDAHIHITQYTSRTIHPLLSRSVTMGHWKAELTRDDEKAASLLGALDLLRSGYTSFVDPGTIFEPEAAAQAAKEIGIRAWITDPYIAESADSLARDVPWIFSENFLAKWPKSLDEALSRMGQQLYRNAEPETTVRGYIGLYGDFTDPIELTQAAVELGRRENVSVQEHLGYEPKRFLAQEARIGMPVLQYFEDQGVLDEHVTFVHMNVLRSDDIDRLARSGASIVWAPYHQLQAVAQGGAIGRMATAYRSGINVGIGTDMARSFNSDRLGTLATIAAEVTGDPVQPEEVFRMRTIGAAATIGAEQLVGSLEPGKRADIVIRRPGASEFFGLVPDQEIGVLSVQDSIDKVIVDGRLTVDDGHVVTVDEGSVVEEATRSARRIAERIGLI